MSGSVYIIWKYEYVPGNGMGQAGDNYEDVVYISLDRNDANEVCKALNKKAEKQRENSATYKTKRYDLGDKTNLGLEIEKEPSVEEINEILKQRVREAYEPAKPVEYERPRKLRRMPNPPFPDER